MILTRRAGSHASVARGTPWVNGRLRGRGFASLPALASWRLGVRGFLYCLSVGAVFFPDGTLSAATTFHTEPRALSNGFQAPYWLVALQT